MFGRGDRIRTCDPLVPNQVLYQAEPLPDGVLFTAKGLRRGEALCSVGPWQGQV